jgi:hypothetical protein
LYRNMLVREADDHTLLLMQAAPRAWLEDGKRIAVKNAPTWFGSVSFEVQSSANSGTIRAALQIGGHEPGTSVLLRIRHPLGKRMQHVTVNGKPWQDFEPEKEWVRIPNAGSASYAVVASY